MNNIKTYSDFILEMKSERDVVRDLARHLSFDKDIIKYLNTSRSKREIGWREMLDIKLHGKNKKYVTYITKNMVADYNPQITGYIPVDKDIEGDFDRELEDERRKEFNDMPEDDKLDNLNDRIMDIEDVLGVDPTDDESIDKVDSALKDAGYEKPEIENDEPEEE